MAAVSVLIIGGVIAVSGDGQLGRLPERKHEMIDRRTFLASGAGAALAAAGGLSQSPAAADTSASARLRLDRHRFGVNYTPSHNWWFCWNDWNRDPIQHDLDHIAKLDADHLRVMLIWPDFQPNLTWISPAHLDRLDGLMTVAAARQLDVLVTVFTGQLSGWFFVRPSTSPIPPSIPTRGSELRRISSSASCRSGCARIPTSSASISATS